MNPERLYTVLLEPHFSEKISILGDQSNQYGFKVAPNATKQEIKEAVEQLFNVAVEKVSTINVKGKVKRTVRGRCA
jgi:large subunit ribosomal protein L23